MEIKISLITATLNSQQTLQRCICSLDAQSFKNWEHLIIDGGSSDLTTEIAKSACTEKRECIREDGLKLYPSLNKGMELVSGDVIGFLHSDDFFVSEESLNKVALMFNCPNTNIVYGGVRFVDEIDSKKILRNWLPQAYSEQKLRFGWQAPHTATFFRKRLIEQIGYFDTQYLVSSDYDQCLKLFKSFGSQSKRLSDHVIIMSYGGKSSTMLFEKTVEDYRILQKHFRFPLLVLVSKILFKASQLNIDGTLRVIKTLLIMLKK